MKVVFYLDEYFEQNYNDQNNNNNANRVCMFFFNKESFNNKHKQRKTGKPKQ